MNTYYLPGMSKYSTAVQDVQMDALPLHLIPGLKALPREDSLLNAAEVGHAYNAVAFSMYKYGVVANTHMTFNWGSFGIIDPDKAVFALSQFNSDTAKWLRVGRPRPNIKRVGRRQGRSAGHFYIYAHENGGLHGFHTHQICYVPPATIGEFRSWAWKRIAKLTGGSEGNKAALHIASWKSKTEEDEVRRGWSAFRYLIKQLNPNIQVCNNDGKRVEVRDIFKPYPLYHLKPLTLSRALCWSHNIGRAAQSKAGFASRYQRGIFEEMYSGLELEEGRKARQELETRNEIQKLLNTIQFEA